MPTLERLFRWERFEPDLGNNRELPPKARFYVEIAVGLTKERLRDLGEKWVAAWPNPKAIEVAVVVDEVVATDLTPAEPLPLGPPRAERLAAVFANIIRMGKEPLSFEGKPITTLAEYFELCGTLSNVLNLIELQRALIEANGVTGMQELFFERLSGGFTSTGGRNIGPAGSQTAAH